MQLLKKVSENPDAKLTQLLYGLDVDQDKLVEDDIISAIWEILVDNTNIPITPQDAGLQ